MSLYFKEPYLVVVGVVSVSDCYVLSTLHSEQHEVADAKSIVHFEGFEALCFFIGQLFVIREVAFLDFLVDIKHVHFSCALGKCASCIVV
jgi:hypothetical protein